MFGFGPKQVFRSETRKSLRVDDQLTLSWQIKDENVQGKAKIRNISETGMMIETNAVLPPYDNCVFSFAPSISTNNIIPLEGKKVWAKKVNFFTSASLIGIEFVNPAQDVISNLRERIVARLEKIKKIERLENIAGFSLVTTMVLIAAFALTQQSSIERSYEETTKLLLTVADQQASLYHDVWADLKETKAVLAETEALLAKVKEENAALQSQLSTANASVEMLNIENEKLTREVTALQEQLRPFEAQIGSLEEGKSFMSAVKKRYRDIKIGIREVRRQANLVRQAAQRERDTVLLAQGNRGFVIKDSKIITNHFPAIKPEKKVKIDVTIVGEK